MSALAATTVELSRWQFAITIIYHFLFVPITIGMGLFVAGLQTAWYRTRQEQYRRLTAFFGKILLINVALGVVTGIVQEFQFGMNWAAYSRYVGDVFGAPLAIEGLVAFFLESVFIGLWVFGAGRLSPRVHLATIWAVALGSIFSAYFILAANSWMQHPVGYRLNKVSGRAEMTSLWAIMTQGNLLESFAHVMAAAVVTAGALALAVSAYHLLIKNEVELFAHAARISLVVLLVGAISVVTVGHFLGQLVAREQPMKMAAAEAIFKTEKPASVSLFAIGPFEKHPSKTEFSVTVPHLLSFLTDWHWSSEVYGINYWQRDYQKEYGAGNYKPIVALNYWSFRLMVGVGFLLMAWSALGLWLARKRRLEHSRRFLRWSIPLLALPFLANTFGWLLREVGRQPWVVEGLLRTSDAFSHAVSVRAVAFTLAGFILVYTLLAGIEAGLIIYVVKRGPAPPAGKGEQPQQIELGY
ncbi:MAG TPA: cytochrome ubiquinol oxidase subunit I [Gaiellaceae bacterium]